MDTPDSVSLHSGYSSQKFWPRYFKFTPLRLICTGLQPNKASFVRFHGIQHRFFIFSILLMMVCVQAFSMHFHFVHEWDQQHSHALAHSHTADTMEAHHSGVSHEDSESMDLLCTLVKHMAPFYFLICACLLILYSSPTQSRRWRFVKKRFKWQFVLFFRPPLRAPPLQAA